MKQSAFGSIGFLILSLVLFACAPAPTAPLVVAATPSAPIVASIPIIESPTFTPILPTLPTSIPETPTFTPIPTASTIDVPTGTLTPLLELPLDGSDFQLSPDAQGLSYITIPPLNPDTYEGPGSEPAVLHLANIKSGVLWEVTSDCTTFVCEFAWLSTGQVMWREAGMLYVADGDGTNRRDLAAPEPIVEIFGVTFTDIVVLRGESHLWRLYLPDGQWDQVPEPQAGPAPVLDYVNQNDRLYFTGDGGMGAISYDVVNHEFPNGYGTVILQIPLERGSVPTYIMPPTPLAYPGTDGGPIPPPIALANAPYWLVNEPLSVSEDGFVPTVPFLIDETGTLVPQTDVLGLPNYRIFNTTLSPDRRWIKVLVDHHLPYPAPVEPSSHLMQEYIAPTEDLANGQRFRGNVLGWQSTPPTLFLWQYADPTLLLHRIALDSGESTILFDTNAPYVDSEISASSTIIFILEKSDDLRLYAFGADGTLVATTALPVNATESMYAYYYLTSYDDRAYLIFSDPSTADNENSWLWQWDVTP